MTGFDNIDPKDKDLRLLPEHHMLMTRRIYGFVLKQRKWGKMSSLPSPGLFSWFPTEALDIRFISAYTPNEHAIDNLVMDPNHRKLVEVLTHKHQDQNQEIKEPWTADFIHSKGEGQIFLLHGPPGVGKTYTAECIAELTGALTSKLEPQEF